MEKENIRFDEYIQHRIRELDKYIDSCIYRLENCNYCDINYYDKEISKTEEIKQELKHILEVCKGE